MAPPPDAPDRRDRVLEAEHDAHEVDAHDLVDLVLAQVRRATCCGRVRGCRRWRSSRAGRRTRTRRRRRAPRTSADLLTSVATKIASPPASVIALHGRLAVLRTDVADDDLSRPPRRTGALSPRPMPVPPPVTIATLPLSRPTALLLARVQPDVWSTIRSPQNRMIQPPSTFRHWPVIQSLADEARKTQRAAEILGLRRQLDRRQGLVRLARATGCADREHREPRLGRDRARERSR